MRVASDHVGAVRAFSRFYTRVIGVLDEGLLHTPYSVTEARVIYELAQRGTTDVADLRRDLGIDAGYMSRITARFADDGLVTRERSESDGRRQVLRLTERGREAFATLDSRSVEQITSLLDGIPPAGRDRLVRAMETIREVLEPERTSPRTFTVRAPRSGEYGWMVARHGALYAAEYGWDEGFEALVARIVADFAEAHDPSREAAWIAEVDGVPAGCVLCVAKDATTAQLRILLVEPSARGMGIGRALVAECLTFATRAGYDTITLWTNDVLVAARRIYEEAGFVLVEEEAHHSFGKDLVGQFWTREL